MLFQVSVDAFYHVSVLFCTLLFLATGLTYCFVLFAPLTQRVVEFVCHCCLFCYQVNVLSVLLVLWASKEET